MYLKSIHIKNYRLLNNVKINVHESATLVVGRNNTGKTSLMHLMVKITKGEKLSFNDYPITYRNTLYKCIKEYFGKKMTFESMIENIALPSIKFIVDYSLDDEEQSLGALSPFIIDTDLDTTDAEIYAEYSVSLTEEKLLKWLDKDIDSLDAAELEKESKDLVKKHFSDFFNLVIMAINPSNKNDIQIKSHAEFKELFQIYEIKAERGLDESDIANANPLSPILTRLFKSDIDDATPEIKDEMVKLRDLVGSTNKDVEERVNELLADIISKSIRFGYPNAEELQLKAITEIALDEQIRNKTDLAYIDQDSLEDLPSTYNGLGYKNLIKIEFELAEFAKAISDKLDISIPILFLEEPESHMHPQLQQTFVQYLDDFLAEISDKPVQVFISTHSSHIVNALPFSQIRYVKKGKKGLIYRDLSEFYNANKGNADFIQKYLTLNRCDLFFADKAILIEGAGERLLFPDMIQKCSSKGIFGKVVPDLASQYCTLIEVGGAFAHKFCDFMNFLGIPTLIITDIDPIKIKEKSVVSKGDTTSNETIKWWIREVKKYDKDKKIEINEIIGLKELDKTMWACHIEYQIEENGICGPSFEEAIINVNRDRFGIKASPTEDDIVFKGSKKTDFALNLLIDEADYNIPIYIEKGLQWLNEQKIINE